MICRILLLLSLTSCVCGTFVVNVTQTSYQAEEKEDITLEWTFTTNTDSSSNSLFIYCDHITGHKFSVLFHLRKGVEVSESQNERFAGRVQWDKDILREGRLRLHVSRLRTDDSGLYICDVMTADGVRSGKCRLTVTAAADEPTEKQPESPAGSLGMMVLYVVLGLTAAAVLIAVGLLCLQMRKKRTHQDSVGPPPLVTT